MSNKFDILKKPIQPHEIEWRVSNSKNGKIHVVPYITNRCVMDRFDEAFTPAGWQNTFSEWRTKGVKAGIGVYLEDEWIWKYDGADESNIEPTKGGFSDSMKRVAVQWGIGRDLYNYPAVYIEADGGYIPNWAKARLEKMVKHIIDKGLAEIGDVVTIKQQ
jgi:hypothetical protein